MNNYLRALLLIFLYGLGSHAWALAPIQGIIYGEMEDQNVNDPFVGMLRSNYFSPSKMDDFASNLLNYTAFLKLGMNLKNSCEGVNSTFYSAFWKEDAAIRSVVAQLQYIGLNKLLHSIVSYASELEYTDKQFETLSTNLVNNSCSPNISVFSKKLLRSNLTHYWKNKLTDKLPSINDNPYYPKEVRELHNTYEVKKKEFAYTVKNFHSLCSWDGSVQNINHLAVYLRNPFIMTYIFNWMTNKKFSLDEKTQQIYTKKTGEPLQVACENMICRKRDEVEFKQIFPRMDGSPSLDDDLQILYCAKFMKLKQEKVDDESYHQNYLEASQFLALLTQTPDLNLMTNDFSKTLDLFKQNIQQRWDHWGDNLSYRFNSEQLFEESLEVSLKSQAKTYDIEVGNFSVDFNIELGEFDKILETEDKISAKFNLEFPLSYIKYLKERIPFLYNNKHYKKLAEVENKLLETITHQMKDKSKYFVVPLWDEKMPKILARELSEQFIAARFLNRHRGKKFVRIPIQFNFGVFALQYIRKKYIFRNNLTQKVSFN